MDAGGIVRRMECQKFRRAAITQCCADRAAGKCKKDPPKDLYKDASKWLCGYMVTRCYGQGCDPKYVSRPLFGKPLCAPNKKGGRQATRRMARGVARGVAGHGKRKGLGLTRRRRGKK